MTDRATVDPYVILGLIVASVVLGTIAHFMFSPRRRTDGFRLPGYEDSGLARPWRHAWRAYRAHYKVIRDVGYGRMQSHSRAMRWALAELVRVI